MNDLEHVKYMMRNSYKHPKATYQDTVTSNFELMYVLNHKNTTPLINWLRQFFPTSYAVVIPDDIMEMAINQVKANTLIRDIL